MSHRLLVEERAITYEELVSQLRDGETLVATWLRDPSMLPNVKISPNANEVYSSVMKAFPTDNAYYVELRFWASTEPTEDYFSYV